MKEHDIDKERDIDERIYKDIANAYVSREHAEFLQERIDLPEPPYSENFKAAMDQIAADLRKKDQRRRYGVRRKVLLVAVACALVIAGATGAVAGGNRFQTIWSVSESTHTNIFFENDNDLPEGWAACYTVTQLPSGYQMTDRIISDAEILTIYNDPSSEETESIMLSQYRTADFISVDSENMVHERVDVLNVEADCYYRAGRTILTWLYNDYYFVLSTTSDKEVAIKVANSLQP